MEILLNGRVVEDLYVQGINNDDLDQYAREEKSYFVDAYYSEGWYQDDRTPVSKEDLILLQAIFPEYFEKRCKGACERDFINKRCKVQVHWEDLRPLRYGENRYEYYGE